MMKKDNPGAAIKFLRDDENGVALVIIMRGLWSLPIFSRISMAVCLLFGRKPFSAAISIAPSDASALVKSLALALNAVCSESEVNPEEGSHDEV